MKELFLRGRRWWRFFQKYRHRMRPAILDNVIRMLSCGLSILGYASYQCSDPGCSHRKTICFSCKSRLCPTCGKKLTDQWIEKQKNVLPDTSWQHITFTMPDVLWELFRYNRQLLNDVSRLAAKPLLKFAKKKGILPGIFTALHTFGRSLLWNIHVHLSITLGGLGDDGKVWKSLYYVKKTLMPMWRYEIINLIRQAYKRGELKLPKEMKGTCTNLTEFNQWLDEQYQKNWIVHFAKPNKSHHKNIKYLGRYLKRPPVSMSRLKHYDGKMVTFEYLNHRTKQRDRFVCEEEEFLMRLLQHVPDKGFRMIRYYGFLANRVRSKWLPKVYNLLDQPERNAITIRFPSLLKYSFGIDPLKCILCGAKMVLTGIVPGKNRAQLMACHEKLALAKKLVLQ